jgi:hypothetical protein
MKKSSWGKKAKPYSPVDIDEPNANVEVYKKHVPETRATGSIAKASSDRISKKKLDVIERMNKAKEKRRTGKDVKKNVLMIKEYMKYLHDKNASESGQPMDIHHWMPKSRIKHNDFFVCCIHPDEHYQIHHGGGSVNGYIEEKGIENLLMDSAIMFAEWLGTGEARTHRYFKYFTAMIRDIRVSPTDYEHVLKVTRECAENIRLEKLNRS